MDRLLQYWAWAQLPLEAGIIFPTKDGLTVEFWMKLTLQRVEDDDVPGTYSRVAKEMWLERLREESPYVTEPLGTLGDDFGMKMRYIRNTIRLWFVPNQSVAVGFTRSLAEEPCAKDKWYSTSDLMAFSHPPLPDCHIDKLPLKLFGPHSSIQDRYDDPEVQGGKIALIAFKQKRVQKPPSFLDRMQSTFMKQVAYNQRILEAENEISGIDCDVSDFLSGMTLDPNEQAVICVNGSQGMKRNEQAMAGQLWMQSDRKMTAANPAFDGMENTREAAILSAVAEAVVWRNEALEIDGPRKGQRVVIYPKELTQLGEVLTTGNPNIEEEKRHHIAYQKVLAAAQAYECPPLFLSEDCDQITSEPGKAVEVANWMCIAERVATGNRRRVLENGPDMWGSDDEALKDVEADEEHEMYTFEMDPKKGPKVLTQAEAARQRAARKALEDFRQASRLATPAGGTPEERKPTPLTSPVNSDDEGMS
jgi:hypothetical protein